MKKMTVNEILKSLEREPAKLKMDDDDIVTTSSGEKITWAESKRRLDADRKETWLYKRFGVYF